MSDHNSDLRLRSLILVIGLALLLSFFAFNRSGQAQIRPVAKAAVAVSVAAGSFGGAVAQPPDVVGNDTIAAMIAAENAALTPVTFSATIPVVFK